MDTATDKTELSRPHDNMHTFANMQMNRSYSIYSLVMKGRSFHTKSIAFYETRISDSPCVIRESLSHHFTDFGFI